MAVVAGIAVFVLFIFWLMCFISPERDRYVKRKQEKSELDQKFENDILRYLNGDYDPLVIEEIVLEKDEQAYCPICEVFCKTDAGFLVITNKRAIFLSSRATVSHEYKSIIRKIFDDKTAIIQLQNKRSTTVKNYVFNFPDKGTMRQKAFYDFMRWKMLFNIFYSKAVNNSKT
ncbi:MAG: hypothetical protein LBU55_00990 [Elusimicrobiota bacterium]|nr:hypothetical protein [Elusimicrobiota bacterium]